MAFITLEDRLGEIEIIVFARQYKQFSEYLVEEGALCVNGSITFEEGEAPRIILESLSPLISNSELKAKREKPAERKIYIKVPTISDQRLAKIYRIAALNRGEAKLVVYDESSKKYSYMKDVSLSLSDKVILKLEEIFSKENVVIR